MDVAAARRRVRALLADQPAVTGRQADSELRERCWPFAVTAETGRLAATVPDEPRAERVPVSREARAAARLLVAPTGSARYGIGQSPSRKAELDADAPQGASSGSAAARPRLETFRVSFSRKGQLGTKLSEAARPAEKAVLRELQAARLEAAGDVLAEQLADDPSAHYYRRAVAAALEPLWLKRAVALASCGEAGARCDCADCGAPHVLPYRCGARACPTCARTASAIACEKVARTAESAALELLEPWDGEGAARPKAWRTLVLTTEAAKTEEERYDPETLRAYVLAVRRAWGPFWRSTPWGKRRSDVSRSGRPTKRVRRDTLAAMGMEVGDGGMVHIHAAIYGEAVDAGELARLWKLACPVGGFVRSRLMRERRGGAPVTSASSDAFRNALREVLKYLTKGHKTDAVTGALASRARRAAVSEYAMRQQRRVETCGALRLVPAVNAADVATSQKECTACTTVPSAWTWRGMRAPDYVRQNGGFGLSTIVDDDDAAHWRAERRLLALLRQHEARELAAARAHEYRPGGQFYGGAPPPWWDDADEWDTVDATRAG